MTLALDFDDEPESHDGETFFQEDNGWHTCSICSHYRPVSTLYPLEGLWNEWICIDEKACKQRQAERNLADDHNPD